MAATIEKRRFTHDIAQAVLKRIDRLGLKDGDRLPSQARLADELQVSVPSLREGLKELETLGLVRIEHGKGMTVAKPSLLDCFAFLDDGAVLDRYSMKQCLSCLETIEGGAVESGVYRPDELLRLAGQLESGHAEALSAAHRALVDGAGNELLSDLFKLVLRIYRSLGGDSDVDQASSAPRKILGALTRSLSNGNIAESRLLLHDYYTQMSSVLTGTNDARLFYTGSIGGSFFRLGAEISRIVGRNGGGSLSVEPSEGGIENVELTERKDFFLGLTQEDIAHQAYNGVGVFSGRPLEDIRLVCRTHDLHLWIIVPRKLGIHSTRGLYGKRIATGAQKGESSLVSEAVLTASGLSEGDYTPFHLSLSRAADGLQAGRVDALFYLSSGAGDALQSLAESMELEALPVASEILEEIRAAHPYWGVSSIKAGTIAGQEKAVATVGVSAVLITKSAVTVDALLPVLHAIFGHRSELEGNSRYGGCLWQLAAPPDIGVPVHPAVTAYFKGA